MMGSRRSYTRYLRFAAYGFTSLISYTSVTLCVRSTKIEIVRGAHTRFRTTHYTARTCIHICTGPRQIGHSFIWAEQSPQAHQWPHGTAACDLGFTKQMMHVVWPPMVDSGASRRGRVQPDQVREHRARAVAWLVQHDHRALRKRHSHVHVVLVKVDASAAALSELEVAERGGRSRLGDAQIMEPRALLLVRERGRRMLRRRRVPGVAMSSRP